MIRPFRYSNNQKVALAHNGQHQFAARHALCHYPSDSIHTFIPKNACSTMRLSLAIANGCIPDAGSHAWIHQNNATFAAGLRDLVTARFTFVILRDPLDRLASVYLDKIVGRWPDYWQLHGLLGHDGDPDDMTFRAFVQAISIPGNLRANIHWRPQIDFLVYEDYDLWVPFKSLADHIPEIEKRTGIPIVDARVLTRHGNDRYEPASGRCFSDTGPAEIRAMRREGRSPAHHALYDDQLRHQAERLYADDAALVREKCG